MSHSSLSFSLHLSLFRCEHRARTNYTRGPIRPRASSAPRVRIGRERKRGERESRDSNMWHHLLRARSGVPRARRATAYLRPFKSVYVSGNSEAQRSERSLEHVNDPSSPVRGRDRKTDLYPRGRQLTSVYPVTIHS